MNRALVVGADADEIDDLGPHRTRLLGPSCRYLAMELDTSTTDPELAWGTVRPVVRRLDITPPEADDERPDEPAATFTGPDRHRDGPRTSPVRQPGLAA